MTKTIWKFELEVHGTQIIEMPCNAEILTVQTQYGKPCIWAIVDPISPKVDRTFETFGTGHQIEHEIDTTGTAPPIRKYIGTYQLSEGNLIFHVFEQL